MIKPLTMAELAAMRESYREVASKPWDDLLVDTQDALRLLATVEACREFAEVLDSWSDLLKIDGYCALCRTWQGNGESHIADCRITRARAMLGEEKPIEHTL